MDKYFSTKGIPHQKRIHEKKQSIFSTKINEMSSIFANSQLDCLAYYMQQQNIHSFSKFMYSLVTNQKSFINFSSNIRTKFYTSQRKQCSAGFINFAMTDFCRNNSFGICSPSASFAKHCDHIFLLKYSGILIPLSARRTSFSPLTMLCVSRHLCLHVVQ